MSASDRYVLDADVFIQAHRMHYAFDICPGFWNALDRQFRIGSVCSIDRVKEELVGEGDELADWVSNTIPTTFFKGTADQHVVNAFGEMAQWAHGQEQFTDAAKTAFLDGVDGWLVAYAYANNLSVVTHEAFAPHVKKNVKIPNVCVEFDVPYCNTFEMLRAVDEKFVLRTRRRTR